MKKTILTMTLLCASLFGDEPLQPKTVSNAFPYVDLGLGPLPIPCPVVGVGGRFQQGHLGFDLSLQMTTTVVLTAIKENIDLIFYPKPKLESQFYLGMGVGTLQLLERRGYVQGFISPQLLVGNEFTTKHGARRYLQARIDCPLIRQDWMSSEKYHGKRNHFLTSIIFSYGFCF
jgi:hypothetical protein